MDILQIATVSTVTALIISGHQIYMHLTHYNEPSLQKFILRILFMIPVKIPINIMT